MRSDMEKIEIEPKSGSANNINNIKFVIENIDIIKLSKEGFYYMGERIDDIHNVYERFNEWLEKVGMQNRETYRDVDRV